MNQKGRYSGVRMYRRTGGSKGDMGKFLRGVGYFTGLLKSPGELVWKKVGESEWPLLL